ncbi:peroxisomal carnitine O-octanoyltransferase-like isoform X3 [Scylla paramamosain]|uniref:peroxisomal carnitine O-octanoyltransferase-like isoform X3 n=2 Tax=Scylla paramamosain TaxID=85552 RepID=UPI00308392CC
MPVPRTVYPTATTATTTTTTTTIMSVDTKVPLTAPQKVPPHVAMYHSAPGEKGVGGGKTFQFEALLPSLPLPPLQETLDLYLDSVGPHLSPEELQVTRAVVDKFAAGIGPHLHRRLQERQALKRNWLEDWWMHAAYLTFREPLLPCMNTAGPHPLTMTNWKPSTDTAFQHGALYLWAVLHFYQLLREERFKPHATREGQPLSMEQFRWMFNCTRIPGQCVDSLHHCWRTKEEGQCPQHLVVLCKGHIWCLDPWDAKGDPLTPPELEVQIRQVWDSCEAMGPGAGVAALTCDKRELWAQNRDWLKSLSLENMKNLDIIESAAFVFVLDESCPSNSEEVVWEGLCGDTTNRWAGQVHVSHLDSQRLHHLQQ